MEKKIYTAPTFDVVEFSSSDVICTSEVRSIEGNAGLTGGTSDAGYEGPVRANNRGGIWDED